MKKLLSTSYSNAAFNLAMFVLRVAMGALLIPHGYSKLIHFAERKGSFMNFLGIGSTLSLILVIFAELFCPVFLILGLFTRLAALISLFSLSVVLFVVNHSDFFGRGESAALFVAGFFVIVMLGPGKFSIDGAMGK